MTDEVIYSTNHVHTGHDPREIMKSAFDENGNRRPGNFIVSKEDDPISEKGQNLRTGKFQPGNKVAIGRPKGSRNKMTQAFLDRVAGRTEDGLSMEEILMDMAQDPKCAPDLRFKAAKTILELTLPKAASIEVTMEETKLTKDQIDARLNELLAKGMGLIQE